MSFLTFHGTTVEQFVDAVLDILGDKSADAVYTAIVRRNDESDVVMLEPSNILSYVEEMNWLDIKSYVKQIQDMYGIPEGDWYIFTVDEFGKCWGK